MSSQALAVRNERLEHLGRTRFRFSYSTKLIKKGLTNYVDAARENKPQQSPAAQAVHSPRSGRRLGYQNEYPNNFAPGQSAAL